jgi:hypothetical protein
MKKRAVIGRIFSPSAESLGEWRQLRVLVPLTRRTNCCYSRQSPPTRFSGLEPGWKTKTHNRHTSKDRQLLQRLEAVAGGGNAKACGLGLPICFVLSDPCTLGEEASLSLRRHFSSRSAALLVPLNRYLNTLIPRPSEVSGATADLRLKPFNNANFFASLKAHGAALPFKSSTKQREFYERWLRTPAFGLWLARQEDVVGRTLENARPAGAR